LKPSEVRAVLEPYLAGQSNLLDLVARLRAIGPAPSRKVQAKIESLLHEAALTIDPQSNASSWPGSIAVVRGLANEILDSLPNRDVVPHVETVVSELSRQASTIAGRFGIALVGLGGSTVAANRTAFSDIDVAARAMRKITLADIAGASDVLNTALDWPVDLVLLDHAEPEFLERFEKNLIPLMAGAL
jgi:predicted nucleotidyltransferase